MKNVHTRKGLLYALMLLLGGALGYAAATMGMAAAGDLSAPEGAWLLVAIYPSFLLVIALHEGGHALAGRFVGFHLKMFVFGPFMIQQQQGRWRLRWNNNVNLGGGMVLSLPGDDRNLARRFAWFVAGGPLASLASFILFAGLFGWTQAEHFPFSLSAFWAYLCLLLTIFSLGIFLATVVPFHTGGFSSDGMRVWQLSAGGDQSRLQVLMIQLISSLVAGTKPDDLPTAHLSEVNQLAEKLHAPLGVYLKGLMHLAALERGEIAAATNYLQQWLDRAAEIAPGLQNTLWLDAAYFFARVEKNPERADQYLAKYKPTAMIPKAQALLTRAAVALAHRDYQAAAALLQQAKRDLPSMYDRGTAKTYAERIKTIERELQAFVPPANQHALPKQAALQPTNG